jgi:hypothetical protein
MENSCKKKQHSKPCRGCPWRRASINGYLGASTPEALLAVAQSPLEPHTPCHLQVNYRSKDWEVEALAAPQCAGRAIFLANQGIVPKGLNLLRQPQIKKDTKIVFASGEEFLVHHNGKVSIPEAAEEVPKPDFYDGLELPGDRIEAEIVRLRHIKPKVRHHDLFGEDNRAKITVQIEILTERLSYEKTIDKYGDTEMMEAAVDAADFITGSVDSLAGPEGWAGIAS